MSGKALFYSIFTQTRHIPPRVEYGGVISLGLRSSEHSRVSRFGFSRRKTPMAPTTGVDRRRTCPRAAGAAFSFLGRSRSRKRGLETGSAEMSRARWDGESGAMAIANVRDFSDCTHSGQRPVVPRFSLGAA